nr:hypothetical protein [Tanacetum cinerariifolium]
MSWISTLKTIISPEVWPIAASIISSIGVASAPYADFMKCHPLNFKGTEGVFVSNETEKVDKYISRLPDNIYGNVKSSKPKTLDETIELANDLMDQKLRTYAERKSDSKRKADGISRNNQ